MKPKEKRMKEIDTMLSHIANFEAHKAVHTEYAAIRFKKPKGTVCRRPSGRAGRIQCRCPLFQGAFGGNQVQHQEIERGTDTACRRGGRVQRTPVSGAGGCKDSAGCAPLAQSGASVRAVPPDSRAGRNSSIQQAVKGRAQRIREEQGEKRQQPRTEKKQDMEL